MIGLKENPLAPASLATGGAKGASAKAGCPCGAQHTAQALASHYLARVAVDAAREQMDALALATDDPPPGMVDAADFLDAAAHCLRQFADISDAIKGSQGGEA